MNRRHDEQHQNTQKTVAVTNNHMEKRQQPQQPSTIKKINIEPIKSIKPMSYYQQPPPDSERSSFDHGDQLGQLKLNSNRKTSFYDYTKPSSNVFMR